jgi:DNA (cytosine-5)-methyltransferase 1
MIDKRDGASPAEDDAPSYPESEASRSYGTTRPRPRLLELFSGAGGSAMGWHRAGFEVVCVDLAPQPRCPFEFHRGDAIAYAKEHAHEFDVIAGGPPCKVHTDLKAFADPSHVDLIPDTREVMIASGLPYVIENVPGARRALRGPVEMCGSSFDLGVERHRLFESNVELYAPPCDHRRQAILSPGYPVKRYHSGRPEITMSPVIGVYGRGQGLGSGEVDLWRKAMGIDWMTRDELSQAIPPAYTYFLGVQLMRAIA